MIKYGRLCLYDDGYLPNTPSDAQGNISGVGVGPLFSVYKVAIVDAKCYRYTYPSPETNSLEEGNCTDRAGKNILLYMLKGQANFTLKTNVVTFVKALQPQTSKAFPLARKSMPGLLICSTATAI